MYNISKLDLKLQVIFYLLENYVEGDKAYIVAEGCIVPPIIYVEVFHNNAGRQTIMHQNLSGMVLYTFL
ncbi:hypothetical protein rsdtw13_23610 [Clostridium sp. TW13]|uniref:Uncharacterized protein n=1 Tax=Inconstantimicrobium mannanitabidum TaxID=1604901 RepID=A0ACB5RCW0_9CLOT|nr:hypothetical protein rsdtw13_23610 [Clostridium sp. TW13]